MQDLILALGGKEGLHVLLLVVFLNIIDILVHTEHHFLFDALPELFVVVGLAHHWLQQLLLLVIRWRLLGPNHTAFDTLSAFNLERGGVFDHGSSRVSHTLLELSNTLWDSSLL